MRTRQMSILSGGELQRAPAGPACPAERSGLLVLGEPAGGVDYVGEAELYALMTVCATCAA